jgi:hypothetical protein
MKPEFLLVTSADFVSFQDRVNKLLGKGYQMLGTPFSHGTFLCLGMYNPGDAYYQQAASAPAPEAQ